MMLIYFLKLMPYTYSYWEFQGILSIQLPRYCPPYLIPHQPTYPPDQGILPSKAQAEVYPVAGSIHVLTGVSLRL